MGQLIRPKERPVVKESDVLANRKWESDDFISLHQLYGCHDVVPRYTGKNVNTGMRSGEDGCELVTELREIVCRDHSPEVTSKQFYRVGGFEFVQ